MLEQVKGRIEPKNPSLFRKEYKLAKDDSIKEDKQYAPMQSLDMHGEFAAEKIDKPHPPSR